MNTFEKLIKLTEQFGVPFIEKNGTVLQADETPLTPEMVEAFNSVETDILAESIRSKRNQLIADTDHMLLPDYPITSEQLIAVKAYRQELRDIPEQSGFPTNVIWPEGV